jgi:hypothetical protein
VCACVFSHTCLYKHTCTHTHTQETKLSAERAQISSRMKRSRRHPGVYVYVYACVCMCVRMYVCVCKDIDELNTHTHSLTNCTGKPTFQPVLDKNTPKITPTDMCDPVEVQRRKDIRAYGIQFELKINEKAILKTETCRINFPEWTVAISQSVNVQLLSVPQTISINVLHKRLLVSQKIGEVLVGIPELNAGQHSSTYDYVGVPIPDLGHTGACMCVCECHRACVCVSLRMSVCVCLNTYDRAHIHKYTHTGFELVPDGATRFVRGSMQCAAYWLHDDKTEIVDAHRCVFECERECVCNTTWVFQCVCVFVCERECVCVMHCGYFSVCVCACIVVCERERAVAALCVKERE